MIYFTLINAEIGISFFFFKIDIAGLKPNLFYDFFSRCRCETYFYLQPNMKLKKWEHSRDTIFPNHQDQFVGPCC